MVLVDQPGEAFGAGQIAGRVVFEPSAALLAALEALVKGQPGQAWPYSAELGGLQLIEIDPQALSAGRRQALEGILQALADGTLDPGLLPPTP
jgi:hypothetical protein